MDGAGACANINIHIIIIILLSSSYNIIAVGHEGLQIQIGQIMLI